MVCMCVMYVCVVCVSTWCGMFVVVCVVCFVCVVWYVCGVCLGEGCFGGGVGNEEDWGSLLMGFEAERGDSGHDEVYFQWAFFPAKNLFLLFLVEVLLEFPFCLSQSEFGFNHRQEKEP